MFKIVKCTCGMHYNAAEKEKCPYCGNNTISSGKSQAQDFNINDKSHVPQDIPDEKDVKREDVEVKTEVATYVQEPKKSGLFRRTQSFGKIQLDDETKESERKYDDKPKVEEPENYREMVDDPFICVMHHVSDKPEKYEPVSVHSGSTSIFEEVNKSRRTRGKFVPSNDQDIQSPVVGWLVCVKGYYYGQSFPLKNGKNHIGRSPEMDIALMNDDSISRKSVAVILFDPRGLEFSVMMGESDRLSYLNEKPIYDRSVLALGDELEFGEDGLNKFVFVPLCGPAFNWKSYPQEN